MLPNLVGPCLLAQGKTELELLRVGFGMRIFWLSVFMIAIGVVKVHVFIGRQEYVNVALGEGIV